MSESSALAQLAETIGKERELLTTGIAELTELFHGENGYFYHVYMRPSDDSGDISWTFRNSPTKTYPQPVEGGRWPYYLEGRNDWIVLYWERGYQEEAVAAQKEARRARDSATGLASMTSDDLDALIELPDILDRNVQALRRARQSFADAVLSMNERKQEVINSDWQDDGALAYRGSIDIQVERFDRCRDDVDTLDEANVALALAAVDVYEALAQIYIDEMKEAGEMIKTIIGVKSLTDWQTYAKGLADLMVGAVTRHAEDFKETVRKLGDMVDAERIVAKAEEIGSGAEWPSPTGEALTG